MSAAAAHPLPRLDPTAALGPVILRARDAEALAAWYGQVLGLVELGRSDGAIALGTADGTPLAVFAADPAASRPSRREPGLYHTAFLLPTRAALGAWLRHTAALGLRLQGAADHLVSEAVYLADPEGNGIEVYRDRDRPDWPRIDGRIRMDNAPLDADGILAAGDALPGGWQGAPAGTTVGHVHLKVADLAAARRFYVDDLGFDVTEEGFPSALFVSAGGYHHHLGLNTWESARGTRTPGAAGLAAVTVTLPAPAVADLAERLASRGVGVGRAGDALLVADPSGNRVAILPAGRPLAAVLAIAAA